MSLSNITLTAAVRQNLLSLQDTASLLATTQGRLATGKKVNSALDNPTNFFTAAGLDARASDISNLLDSIGNGVQVLQAANTGITSLSKLVDTAKSIANQVLQQPTGYTTKANVTIATPASAGTATDLTNAGAGTLQGKTLIFKTSTGTTTLTLSNVAGAGNVNSISSLNSALSAAGVQLQASFNSNGSITFTSSNDAASQTITATGAFVAPPAGSSTSVDVSGTATFGAVTAAVADPVSQATRSSLVSQYNQILTQITTTAQDASFNGINLLNGDSLKLVFDETGKSTSTIPGVTFNPTGLGLASLTAGNDFIDTVATNIVLTNLNNASITLRSQASAFGANLSIVQIRQDFNKNIINVLQTGSSALTLADSNEEAANSQALSTRQSIATSALALANQAQQNVLQLLR
ncbi:MAG TPA: flagellin [Bradyrhizobium sp.]|jgi:flagellin-like hook-associated protein FlgL|nr:flagellin [Bradyrhizobium sp.]